MSFERVSAKSHLRLSLAPAFLTACLVFLSPLRVFAVDEIKMPCEVLEVSGSAKTLTDAFQNIHFMVIHHANAVDRERLSKWLKENSGTEVTFFVRHQIHKGILYRLAHCFGRGLLLSTDKIDVKARDIILVNLPRLLLQ